MIFICFEVSLDLDSNRRLFDHHYLSDFNHYTILKNNLLFTIYYITNKQVSFDLSLILLILFWLTLSTFGLMCPSASFKGKLNAVALPRGTCKGQRDRNKVRKRRGKTIPVGIQTQDILITERTLYH